jgi:hypothetical protein
MALCDEVSLLVQWMIVALLVENIPVAVVTECDCAGTFLFATPGDDDDNS